VVEPSIEVAEAAGVGIDGLERPTEDRVVRLPHAVVLADGATSLREGEPSGGWYAERLCTALAAGLTARPDVDLRTLLAEAITTLAAEHGLVPGESPCSTVAMLRWSADLVDALVLADSPIVVFTDLGAHLLADDRITGRVAPGDYRRRLLQGGGYGPAHEAALRESGSVARRQRNVEGGFWVAEADPAAAEHARTASWPREHVTQALLATDGVSCGVDDYHIFDWPQVLDHALDEGPAAVLTMVRVAEIADPDGARWPRPKRHDDKTLVLVRF
jgi:hypothetical protein